MERAVWRTIILVLVVMIFCRAETAKAAGSASLGSFPDIKKIIVHYVGTSAEVSFNIKEKKVARGWDFTSNKIEIWTDSFLGWNLSWTEVQNDGHFELSALLDAQGCWDGLGDYCRYLGHFPDSETDNGTLYSNFGVNYYFCRSRGSETIIYISQMYHDQALAALGISEIGLVSSDRSLLNCGESLKKIPLGKWSVVGISLGKEWVPFHGLMNVTKKSVTAMVVHDNSGMIMEIKNIDLKNANIWVQCERELVIIWKNVYNGSDSGYLILLKKNH